MCTLCMICGHARMSSSTRRVKHATLCVGERIDICSAPIQLELFTKDTSSLSFSTVFLTIVFNALSKQYSGRSTENSELVLENEEGSDTTCQQVCHELTW